MSKAPTPYEVAKTEALAITHLLQNVEHVGECAARLMGDYEQRRVLHDDELAAQVVDVLREAVAGMRQVFRSVSEIETALEERADQHFKITRTRKVLRVVTFGLVGDGR